LQGIDTARSFRQVALAAADAAARMNGSAEAARIAAEEAEAQQQAMQAQLELSRQITEQENQRNARHAERIQDIQNEIRLLQIELQQGKESVEYQTELNRQARARVVTEMMAAGHTAESIAAYIALVREAQELEGAVRAAGDAADDTADAASRIGPALSSAVAQANAFANAMARARSESAGIGISTAGARTEREALEAGLSPAQARAEAAAVEERLRLQQSGDLGVGPTVRAQLIEQQVEARRSAVLERELEQERLNQARSAARNGGGGGGGGGGDVFTSLIPSIEALAEAVRLANEQTQAYEQSVDILDDALQHGLITQQEYNTLLTQAQEAYGQAQTAAYDYEAAIEQVANKASSAMEDAFMSIVDGSATAADAFRNMAREILAEAFKMLVVRPIMNSLFGGGGGGGILSALAGGVGVKAQEYGNAFHAGRVIPFANGGVVSSPTMFPMRGNTGLMGEAGPEAIMPLKRGRDGKLGVQAEGGGGQSIVIHQSFNFQANGDESVKRIIAQEAPKIANLTQQQIIDQRKRGGVMKATF
jgi:lambda family phage tail tape measure protein